MVRGGEDRRVIAHERPGQGELCIGFVIGGPDIALANGEPAIRDTVTVGVVVVRVGIAVHVGRRDQAHELVAELVRHRIADHGQLGIRLERAQDVPEDRVAVRTFKVATLLDVGVLVDDLRLHRREIGGDVGRQVVRDVLLKAILAIAARGQAIAGRGRARRDRAVDRGEVELEVR